MALQAILAAVGVATSAYGFFKSQEAGDQAASIAQQQADISRQVSAQQQKIEKVRQQQAFADRLNVERNILRAQQRARSQALSNSTQGGSGIVVGSGQGGSSGLQGAFGAINGATGTSLTQLTSNFNRGQQIFAANAKIASLGNAYNNLQSDLLSVQGQQNYGKELFNFGANLAGNSQQYAQTFSSLPGLFKGQ